ncbi:hypothetical protein [Sphingomonas sp.]|uniref:hypothetical protein n=1 Tax=Sphingomonas sp. TaxID=28214 RepID=UPI003AFFA8A6
MSFLVPIGIVTAVMARGAFTTWVKAKHGYPIEDKRSRRERRDGHGETLVDSRKVALLTGENERLHGQVGRLEERIAVLERIVTDPAERTAREIDALR